ncbi:hypothetical protein [Ruminococcus sp.]|uniref:hypothetical protein n=1 Tax=Ruminococcus sp. TaxID=41978 RepID=UPI001B0B4992|nr:hypothetical protein [Ruminococcus sp.]MBO5558980.1 hypothetical protein [Ruminococcus sp.]
MKIGYTYFSYWFYFVLYGGLVFFYVLIALGSKTINVDIVLLVISVYLVLFEVLLLILAYVPVQIDAQESSMSIKILFNTTLIKYSDITQIKLERVFAKAVIRGDQDHYNEILTIDTKDGRNLVYRHRREIDHEKLLQDPDDLKHQFDNGEFAQLKAFIEGKMA